MPGGNISSVTADAILKESMGPTRVAAGQRVASDERAVLDEADLQELDRAAYYPTPPAATETPVAPPRRSLIDRLFRR